MVDVFLIASRKFAYKLNSDENRSARQGQKSHNFKNIFQIHLLGYWFCSKPHLLDGQVQPYLNIMKISNIF